MGQFLVDCDCEVLTPGTIARPPLENFPSQNISTTFYHSPGPLSSPHNQFNRFFWSSNEGRMRGFVSRFDSNSIQNVFANWIKFVCGGIIKTTPNKRRRRDKQVLVRQQTNWTKWNKSFVPVALLLRFLLSSHSFVHYCSARTFWLGWFHSLHIKEATVKPFWFCCHHLSSNLWNKRHTAKCVFNWASNWLSANRFHRTQIWNLALKKCLLICGKILFWK